MKINIVRPDGEFSGIFLELAELMYYSIRELGYEVEVSISKVKSKSVNLIIGIFYSQEFWQEVPDSSIVINTEPLLARATEIGWTQTLFQLANRFEIWDYDPRNLRILREVGFNNTRLMKLGYQSELERITNHPDSDRSIDVLFYGSLNHRRNLVLDKVVESGLVSHKFFGIFGSVRDEMIARSKMVINLHYNEVGVFEIIRYQYLLNNGVAIVPEIGPETSIDPIYLDFFVGVPYLELVDRCVWLKENPDELLNLRERSLTEFKKTPHVVYMEELLKRI